jgi:hypothetical protein
MRLLQPTLALAVPELPKLGNTAPGIARAIRHGSATQHHDTLNIPQITSNRAISSPVVARHLL